jgi:hypothetical protein
VQNLAHSASFHSKENNGPSKPGIKQLTSEPLLQRAVKEVVNERLHLVKPILKCEVP